MDIFHPDKHTFSLIKDFVKPYEEKCVLLCSKIRKESEKVFVISQNIKNENDGARESITPLILGILYVDSTLFHCIPEKNIPLLQKQGNFIYSTICKIMDGKKIKCISGHRAGTDFFHDLFKCYNKNPYQINSYKLMTLTSLPVIPAPLSNGDEIIRCTGNDIDRLRPVQKKYLQEEVAPKGKIVSDLEVSMTLRDILKSQLCVSVISDGEIAAKANTNAIGFSWIQIGGVYTLPQFRRNGYSHWLVFWLCRRALRVKKNIALFVKEKNEPAICLYKKLGFLEKDFYKIVYY